MALFDSEIETVQDGHGVHMWPADYIGQTHTLDTSNLYCNTLPGTLERLTESDYAPKIEEKRRLESSSLKEKKTDSSNVTMSLTLKFASVTRQVLKVNKILSPVKVQHLIDLASGANGDIAMERSAVLASNVKSNNNKGVGQFF